MKTLDISCRRYHHRGFSAYQLLIKAYNFVHHEIHAAFVGAIQSLSQQELACDMSLSAIPDRYEISDAEASYGFLIVQIVWIMSERRLAYLLTE